MSPLGPYRREVDQGTDGQGRTPADALARRSRLTRRVVAAMLLAWLILVVAVVLLVSHR
jgi:hypothetical protein